MLSRRRGYLSSNSPFLVMGEAERDTFDNDTKKVCFSLHFSVHNFVGIKCRLQCFCVLNIISITVFFFMREVY